MNENSSLSPNAPVTLEKARSIASLFELPGRFEIFDFARKGNINQDTYLIKAGLPGNCAEYILQLLNPRIFRQPRAVMNSMIACIQAQNKALSEGALRSGEEWETIQLVPTKAGNAYLEEEVEEGIRCWRMMVRIHNTYVYKSLSEIPDPNARSHVAEEAGRGLALFGILTAGMDAARVTSSLPGYRDTSLYYDQLASVLEGNRTLRCASSHLPSDPEARQGTERHYLVHLSPQEYRRRMDDAPLGRCIAQALDQKPLALTLVRGLKTGELKKAVIHGDTKLDNFLFSSSTGKVRAMVDLDTIMPHTWLTDWGDMVRSLVNAAGEREKDLEKIAVDLGVFKAIARGFLDSARNIALQEIELMADAAQIMALELGVRFLADYLRGDSYFRLSDSDPRDLNKTRALVQFCVFENLRKQAASMKLYIREIKKQLQGILQP
jgi:N-acetylhexosamine 1-kinase